MPISELGYRHWEGTRTGALRRMLAIARSEVSIAYHGSKLLRRFLVLAWFPTLYFCPLFLAVGYVADPSNDLDGLLAEMAMDVMSRAAIEQVRANPGLFLPQIWGIAFYFFFAYTQSVLAMIVVAIVGPPLIARDLRSKAFLVYFSKPIEPWQYLAGKVGTVTFFVLLLTLLPALLLYSMSIALSPDVGTLVATAPIVLQAVAASLATAIPISLVVLLLSSLTKHRLVATFSWIALFLFGEIAYRVLAVASNFGSDYRVPDWAPLLSLRELTTRAAAGIFDLRGNLESLFTNLGESGGRFDRELRMFAREMGDAAVMDRRLRDVDVLDLAGAGYGPWVAIAVLAGISAGAAVLVMRQVRKPVRI